MDDEITTEEAMFYYSLGSYVKGFLRTDCQIEECILGCVICSMLLYNKNEESK